MVIFHVPVLAIHVSNTWPVVTATDFLTLEDSGISAKYQSFFENKSMHLGSKLSRELKNCIGMSVGQVAFKLLIKTLKMMF